MLDRSGSAARKEIDAVLAERLPKPPVRPVFYAVGGGWRALARIHMAESGAPVSVAHGYALEAGAVRAFAKRLWRLQTAKLGALAGVPLRRLPTLPAAALVMDRVLKRLAPERVVFSALGVREGWLYAQLPAAERYRDPLVEGAQAFGLPQARVPEFAPALVRWTDHLVTSEAPAERRLRLAVCALSDIGWRDHRDVQAFECFDRLLQFPFIGVEHAERVFIATAIHARYAGDLEDPRLSPAIGLLPKPAPPARPDPRPRPAARLPAFGQRAGDPRRLAIADRLQSRPRRGRQEGARARQRGGGGPAQAAGKRTRRPPHGSGRGELEHDECRFSRRSTSCHTGESRYP